MARYNEILVGRLNRFLQKYLSMKGDAPAPQLASDWTPTINFDNGVELRYLEGWNRYQMLFNTLAVAANGSAARVRNPVAGNVVGVLEKILIVNFNAAAFSVRSSNGATAVDLPTPETPSNSRLDPRGGPSPTLVFTQSNTVAGVVGDLLNPNLAVSLAVNAQVDTILTEDQQIPILPGDAWQWVTTAVNQQLVISIQWRERFLEESERT